MRAEVERRDIEGAEHDEELPGGAPGTVAIPCGEQIRSPKLVFQLQSLISPPGTTVYLRSGMGVVEALNEIVNGLEGDWLWLQSDDHIWSGKTTLMSLLAREVDVIVPLMTRRSPPFTPLIFKARHEDGYEPFTWAELPTEGLVEVHAAGSGGMLIRRHVIERVLEGQGHEFLFEYENSRFMREDLYLCEKIHRYCPDVKIYADMEVSMGHVIANAEVWPTVGSSGNWGLAFDLGVDDDGKHALVTIDG